MKPCKDIHQKIEANLLDRSGDEKIGVFLHADPNALDLLTEDLHTMSIELEVEPYPLLGFIFVRLSVKEMEQLAYRSDVIKISSQGNFTLLEQESPEKADTPTERKPIEDSE